MKRFDRVDGAFLTGALLLPASVLCARFSPAAAAAGALAAGIILYCMAWLAGYAPAGFRMPRWFAALRAVWCCFVLGLLLDLTRGLFPLSHGAWIVPAVLALLAALAAAKGSDVAPRMAAVLWPFLLALVAVVALFAAPDIEPERLASFGSSGETAAALALVLLPGMRPMRRGRAKMPAFLLLAVVLTALPPLLCFGTLGRAQTAALPFPLYASAQSISVFGVMERFEVLLSAALTASGFCALSFALGAALDGLPGASSAAQHTKSLVLAAAGFALMAAVPHLPGWFWPAGSAVFCGLLPLGILAVGARKKVEKNPKKSVDKPNSI